MKDTLRRLFRRASADEQIREEIESHIAMRAEQNEQAGMPPGEALRSARRRFGNPASVRETLYDYNRFGLAESILVDVLYALRGLRRNLALSLTAVVTVAIGVGAVASMFSVMRNLLLASPPHVDAPDRIFRLYQLFPADSEDKPAAYQSRTNYPFYEVLARRSQFLESVAAYADGPLAVGTGADAGMARVSMSSAGFWKTLGVRPALGRFIQDREAHPATGARVVVLGHAFWQSRFGGRADAVGQTIRIKGQRYEIIGVAPRGFRGVELTNIDMWLPLFARDDGSGRATYISTTAINLKVVMRLKPDATVEQASAELTGFQRAFLDESPVARSDAARRQRYRRARGVF